VALHSSTVALDRAADFLNQNFDHYSFFREVADKYKGGKLNMKQCVKLLKQVEELLATFFNYQ